MATLARGFKVLGFWGSLLTFGWIGIIALRMVQLVAGDNVALFILFFAGFATLNFTLASKIFPVAKDRTDALIDRIVENWAALGIVRPKRKADAIALVELFRQCDPAVLRGYAAAATGNMTEATQLFSQAGYLAGLSFVATRLTDRGEEQLHAASSAGLPLEAPAVFRALGPAEHLHTTILSGTDAGILRLASLFREFGCDSRARWLEAGHGAALAHKKEPDIVHIVREAQKCGMPIAPLTDDQREALVYEATVASLQMYPRSCDVSRTEWVVGIATLIVVIATVLKTTF